MNERKSNRFELITKFPVLRSITVFGSIIWFTLHYAVVRREAIKSTNRYILPQYIEEWYKHCKILQKSLTEQAFYSTDDEKLTGKVGTTVWKFYSTDDAKVTTGKVGTTVWKRAEGQCTSMPQWEPITPVVVGWRQNGTACPGKCMRNSTLLCISLCVTQ